MHGEAKTYKQILSPSEDLPGLKNQFDCYFYVCEDGVDAATEVCLTLDREESAPFGTPDKPYLPDNPLKIKGRYVDGDQNIYVLQGDRYVFLRNMLEVNGDLQKRQKLAKALKRQSE